MTGTKMFHIGDIISVTSGRMVSPRHIDGLYDLLGFMSGQPVAKHQLPQAGRECEEPLRRQFPDLAFVTPPAGLNSKAAVLEWLAALEPSLGKTREVRPLAAATALGKPAEGAKP